MRKKQNKKKVEEGKPVEVKVVEENATRLRVSDIALSTDYEKELEVKLVQHEIECRKPSDQEFFRASPLPEHSWRVLGLKDKQDVGREYVISAGIRDAVLKEFPLLLRKLQLTVVQTLVGQRLLCPVPLGEDKRGQSYSSHRAAFDQAKTKWTRMAHTGFRYNITTCENDRTVDWKAFPSPEEILTQALADHLIETLDHPVLEKLRGKVSDDE